jgi:hypothetical protein
MSGPTFADERCGYCQGAVRMPPRNRHLSQLLTCVRCGANYGDLKHLHRVVTGAEHRARVKLFKDFRRSVQQRSYRKAGRLGAKLFQTDADVIESQVRGFLKRHKRRAA